VENYLNLNNSRPLVTSDDKHIVYLAKWLGQQLRNEKNRGQILSDNIFYKMWTEFKLKYKKYMMSYEEEWYSNL
jgi:hypothetical protein